MPKFSIPYGQSTLEMVLPGGIPVDIIEPAETSALNNPQGAVLDALDHPVGDLDLERIRGARSVAIAINDKTRPVAHDLLLPPLLSFLERHGVNAGQVTFFIANGTHIPMEEAEYPAILPPDLIRAHRVISHDSDDETELSYLGETARGTPVWINRHFVESDLRISVGNLEPHHFMGFSGGVKTAAIGLAGRQTINRNHAWLAHPMSRTAVYGENPMRQDLEEIGDKIGIQIALNAIPTPKKQIAIILAGNPRSVMQEGIPHVQSICQVLVRGQYDLVIAAPGGHPKDINFYQAQKALTHAAMLTRSGGTVILAAACPEGIGSSGYAQWMQGMTSHTDVIERFHREGFRVGPHKAFLVARDAARVRILVVSDMFPQVVDSLLLGYTPSLQAAVQQALEENPTVARIAILPAGTTTVPLIR
jgi:nickel-dependent lactate racemase